MLRNDLIAMLLDIDKRVLITGKIKAMTDIIQIQESEYDAILRQLSQLLTGQE